MQLQARPPVGEEGEEVGCADGRTDGADQHRRKGWAAGREQRLAHGHGPQLAKRTGGVIDADVAVDAVSYALRNDQVKATAMSDASSVSMSLPLQACTL